MVTPERLALFGIAPTARTISAAGLATGGGSLAADRTLTVTAATKAELLALTSTSKVLTPSALAALVMQSRIVNFNIDPTRKNTVGSGYVGSVGHSVLTRSGTTTGSSALIRTNKIGSLTNNSPTGGGSGAGFDWTKPGVISFLNSVAGNDANTVVRIQTKQDGLTTPGRLTVRGVGIEYQNARIFFLLHNGTTLTAHDTGVDRDISPDAFTVVLDGLGTASLYRQGVAIATNIAGAPMTIGNSSENTLAIEVSNGAGTSDVQAYTHTYATIIGL